MDVLRTVAQLDAHVPRFELQPPKTSLRLGFGLNLNVLPAILNDGTSGAKVIWYSEVTRERCSMIVMRDASGRDECVKANGITEVRCGLMVAVCALRLFQPGARLRVGMVGQGRIARAARGALLTFFDAEFVEIRSPRQGGPNFQDLCGCDLVVTCTFAVDGDPRFEVEHYDGPIISLDGDNVVGPTFRACRSIYTDHRASLEAAWDTEFRGEPVYDTLPLMDLRPSRNALIHLYGIGVADLVVAKEWLDAAARGLHGSADEVASGIGRPHFVRGFGAQPVPLSSHPSREWGGGSALAGAAE